MSHSHNHHTVYNFGATDLALSYALQAFDIQVMGKNILTIDAPQTAQSIDTDINTESWIRCGSLKPQKTCYDIILLNAGSHKRETLYMMAFCLDKLLPIGGVLILAGANDSGGKSLANLCRDLGLTYDEISKHKHRIFHIVKNGIINESALKNALADGERQQREDGLWTRLGVFSWDRVDSGSDLLLSVLTQHKLSGCGADFGCGIGVLGVSILLSPQHNISHLDLIDIDIRATDCVAENVKPFLDRVTIYHDDATKFQATHKYDFIISNPPFHKGKSTDVNLGQSFIRNAAKNLKPKGVFYMVANSTLPYESILQTHFSHYELIIIKNGYKIYKATK